MTGNPDSAEQVLKQLQRFARCWLQPQSWGQVWGWGHDVRVMVSNWSERLRGHENDVIVSSRFLLIIIKLLLKSVWHFVFNKLLNHVSLCLSWNLFAFCLSLHFLNGVLFHCLLIWNLNSLTVNVRKSAEFVYLQKLRMKRSSSFSFRWCYNV